MVLKRLQREVPGAIGTSKSSSLGSSSKKLTDSISGSSNDGSRISKATSSKSRGLKNSSGNENISTLNERGFRVLLNGRVESGQFTDVEEITCSYQVVVGPDWQLQTGIEDGETQSSRNQTVSSDKPSVVWNFPIDLAFTSTNISGWPRISIAVRDMDRNIIGYGSVYLPTSNGEYVRYCRLFKPLASTALGDTVASLTKELPEFYDARFTTACVGREAARVKSAGVVKISMSIRVAGARQLGYLI